jgi:putative SOS response-associated peptidase YedK
MCGRFTLRTPMSVIAAHFGVFEVPAFTPRFNIAPTQPVGVVRLQAGRESPHERELVWLRWGLIPRWAKDESIGSRLINARAETVAEKTAYRASLRRHRCLIAADGFYEWQKGDQRSQPFYIRLRDNRPFGLAGLWDHWTSPDEKTIESCVILTTGANALVGPIHDRMPVILPPSQYAQWLDPQWQEWSGLASLCGPYPAEEMVAYAVDPRVNRPAHDDPSCIAPAAQPAQQQSLF